MVASSASTTADKAAPSAPWESAPAHEQLFVLITGANSGVGLGTAQRLVDEFLATRGPAAHLVLLATTRSAAKAREAIREVRAHARRVAARLYGAGGRCACRDAVARIHVLGLTLDLCDLAGVRAFARRLVRGVPRLDCVVFNAAYGGWEGCNYLLAVWSILTKGLIQSVTWPDFKTALPTAILNEQRQSYGYYPASPLLGEVFTACVFGHYMLAHELLPLLSRRPPLSSSTPALAPGRIVWSSSLEAVSRVFSPDDFQCLNGPAAYESAKRLTDVLALTHSLPAARPYSSRWLTMDHDDNDDDEKKTQQPPVVQPPKVYLTHPGIVASTLFPVPWFLFWAYELSLILSRWLGSPWHTVDGYSGAKAAVWLALEPQDALDDARAHRVKWGSSSDRHRRVHVKKTEVEGWGWEGRVQVVGAHDDDDAAASPYQVLRKSIGRKHGVVDATAEDIVRFEELGATCWREVEEMRATWEAILDKEELAKDV
ncbi:3-ketosteroid reductase [Hirsutella rhossiliensis]|uniref:3-ketosteroid reductase n=1 Tax=Hirsutella rhossiliensis TaxID=111463 RepID=A0A9P8MR88_9HYPO|nr:3-ketosteroid reductase [Hirsutella rhossiliensis]KAH0958721.1 3-ketosteroid reductase [Hirsutella rhossiliensis]